MTWLVNNIPCGSVLQTMRVGPDNEISSKHDDAPIVIDVTLQSDKSCAEQLPEDTSCGMHHTAMLSKFRTTLTQQGPVVLDHSLEYVNLSPPEIKYTPCKI